MFDLEIFQTKSYTRFVSKVKKNGLNHNLCKSQINSKNINKIKVIRLSQKKGILIISWLKNLKQYSKFSDKNVP